MLNLSSTGDDINICTHTWRVFARIELGNISTVEKTTFWAWAKWQELDGTHASSVGGPRTVPLLVSFHKNLKLSRNYVILRPFFPSTAAIHFRRLVSDVSLQGRILRSCFLTSLFLVDGSLLNSIRVCFVLASTPCRTEDAFMNGPHCRCVPLRPQVHGKRHGNLVGHWLCFCVFRLPLAVSVARGWTSSGGFWEIPRIISIDEHSLFYQNAFLELRWSWRTGELMSWKKT